jgi:hypothetical protein
LPQLISTNQSLAEEKAMHLFLAIIKTWSSLRVLTSRTAKNKSGAVAAPTTVTHHFQIAVSIWGYSQIVALKTWITGKISA